MLKPWPPNDSFSVINQARGSVDPDPMPGGAVKARLLAVLILLATLPFASSAETAHVNGIEMHYTVQGTGEPLLLLHGFGSCSQNWAAEAAKLAGNYTVISIDARGHGSSTNPSGKFTHDQAAADVVALMDALNIKQARAMGFSSGGITLLHLATRHPDRLSKMVLIGASTHYPEQALAILRDAAMDTLPPDVLEGFRKCAANGEQQVRSLVDQFRAFGFGGDNTNFQANDLARITADTLIVHGDRDIFFPVAVPVAMYGAIKRSALWIVPNGEHEPTGGAAPDDFMRTVEAFFSK